MATRNTKKTRTKGRVWVNSVLLLVLTVALGALTCCGVNQIRRTAGNFQSTVDAPALCYRKYEVKDGHVTNMEDGYVCSSEVGADNENIALTDSNDYAMFLYDRVTFSSVIRSGDLETIVTVVGAMMTLASLIATMVYFNHNRA